MDDEELKCPNCGSTDIQNIDNELLHCNTCGLSWTQDEEA